MIIYYINQGRKENEGSDSIFIEFILVGKISFAFLPPHTFSWGWIPSAQIEDSLIMTCIFPIN